ncbi:MAG: SDR family oxidoreductase [Desulfobacteraceae bacterium]|nr:SDR family oxidoreductase [Desulfobacteraceae bacterium]
MALEQFELKGKTAMVTGSTKGLGEVAAKAMAKAGADVVICGRNEADLKRVPGEIRQIGVKSEGYFMEVTSMESVQAASKKILNDFQKIDILVNNAGTNYRATILETPVEEWARIIDIHLHGTFRVSQVIVPQMIERGYGKVINISSIASRGVVPPKITNCPAYHAAKGGINQLTKVMAVEWAQSGVRANAIAPTYFETDMVKAVKDDPERFQAICDKTPMGRMGELSEFEGIVIFLASPASDFITGEIVGIDGGWTAW